MGGYGLLMHKYTSAYPYVIVSTPHPQRDCQSLWILPTRRLGLLPLWQFSRPRCQNLFWLISNLQRREQGDIICSRTIWEVSSRLKIFERRKSRSLPSHWHQITKLQQSTMANCSVNGSTHDGTRKKRSTMMDLNFSTFYDILRPKSTSRWYIKNLYTDTPPFIHRYHQIDKRLHVAALPKSLRHTQSLHRV